MTRNVLERLGDLARDARYGVRMLAAAPGFALAAAACLGIGIGVVTTIFAESQSTIFKTTPGVVGAGVARQLSGARLLSRL